MNCDWVKEHVALYVYDELPDDARHEMEQHMERCLACAAEVQEIRELREIMGMKSVHEPSANLLTASRMRLQESLETAEQNRGWSRFTFDLAGWLHQAKLSPALVVVLLMVGFGGGVMATFGVKPGPGPQPPLQDQAAIAGIRNITQDPNSNAVEIRYDTLQSERVQGSLDDPKIQQLLLFAARNNLNSGVRMDSIDLLTKNPEGQVVREALVQALHNDSNPGVRLKALDGLRAYVRDDVEVRDAVIEALINDDNPGVRSMAISLLQPVRSDASVRQALQLLAEQDENQYIRQESRRVLANLPEID